MVSALAVDSSDRLISGGWDKTVPWPLEKVEMDQMDVGRYWINLDGGLVFFGGWYLPCLFYILWEGEVFNLLLIVWSLFAFPRSAFGKITRRSP